MYDLTYPQKKNFLEEMKKTLFKNPEKVGVEKVETSLQIRTERSPEFKEELYKCCRLHKKIHRIPSTKP